MKMAVFNVKMLPFLLVMVLMCSGIVLACSVVPAYRLDFENQDGEEEDGREDEDEDEGEEQKEARELDDEDADDDDDGDTKSEKGEEDHKHKSKTSSKTSTSKHGNQHGKKVHGHSNKTSTSKHGNQHGKKVHSHSSKTSTSKHGNQHGKEVHGHSRKISTCKLRNQNGMEGRAVQAPRIVSNNPNQPCYTRFFVGRRPPTGLRTGQNLQSIRYICQMVNQLSYYSTMFDESRGIAVFSAYILTQAIFQNFPRPSWRQTPGIMRQGSDAIYLRSGFQKGHLVPSQTYSITRDSFLSTFEYTNAVPQHPAFNGGQWAQFERRIRLYASICTRAPQPGTLYLLTGSAFGHVTQSNPPGYNPQIPVDQLGPVGNNPAIAIPNLMWTAGCCVFQNCTVKSFAVVGNNLPGTTQLFTQQITVALLEDILTTDVVNLNIGGPNVDLFPGNGRCSSVNNDLPNLP